MSQIGNSRFPRIVAESLSVKAQQAVKRGRNPQRILFPSDVAPAGAERWRTMEANHWNEWRSAVERVGYCAALAKASERLQMLDEMTPEQVEELFRGNRELQPLGK